MMEIDLAPYGEGIETEDLDRLVVEGCGAAVDRNLVFGIPDETPDSEIVPDEDQNTLISIRERQTIDCFRIGDIANRLVERAIERWVMSTDKNQKRVTSQRVYAAIGRFCGKSARTIRYYAETAAFYGQESRSRFDVLPFAHFVFARSVGDSWQAVLEYSLLDPTVTLAHLQKVFVDGSDSLAETLFGVGVVSDSGPGRENDDSADHDNSANIRTFSEPVYSLESGAAADFIANGFQRQPAPVIRVNVFGDLLTALDRAQEFVSASATPPELADEFRDSVSSMRETIARLLSATG